MSGGAAPDNPGAEGSDKRKRVQQEAPLADLIAALPLVGDIDDRDRLVAELQAYPNKATD